MEDSTTADNEMLDLRDLTTALALEDGGTLYSTVGNSLHQRPTVRRREHRRPQNKMTTSRSPGNSSTVRQNASRSRRSELPENNHEEEQRGRPRERSGSHRTRCASRRRYPRGHSMGNCTSSNRGDQYITSVVDFIRPRPRRHRRSDQMHMHRKSSKHVESTSPTEETHIETQEGHPSEVTMTDPSPIEDTNDVFLTAGATPSVARTQTGQI